MKHEDLAQIFQAVLDIKALQQYFHGKTAADEKPLLILKNEHTAWAPRLTKFGAPVRYVTKEQAGSGPFLELSQVSGDADDATVEFRYPSEGIRGRVVLKKVDSSWKVESSQIHEN